MAVHRVTSAGADSIVEQARMQIGMPGVRADCSLLVELREPPQSQDDRAGECEGGAQHRDW